MNPTTPHPSPLPERGGEGGRFAEAREVQWVWKTAAMETMAAAVCRLAIEKAGQEFSANDLSLEDHGGTGICGSIFKRLAKDEVIAPVGWWGEATDEPARGDARPTFQQKTVGNTGGNRIGVWRLKSYARALRLVELHAAREDARPTIENFKQAELAV